MNLRRVVLWFDFDVKAYVRTTKRQRYVDPKYMAYSAAKALMRDEAKGVMLKQGLAKMPPQTPLRMAIFVCLPSDVGHKRDLSNIVKGIEDGLQHQVYDNDAWIDQLAAVRIVGNSYLAAVIVQPVEDGPESFSDWLKDVETWELSMLQDINEERGER